MRGRDDQARLALIATSLLRSTVYATLHHSSALEKSKPYEFAVGFIVQQFFSQILPLRQLHETD
jgi:hypothetical protein